MKRYSTEMKKKIVTSNIQDGRTIASLATEYGVSIASINNWKRDYRKECQATPETMSEFELMEENGILKLKLADSEKENDFLKKQLHSLRRKQASNLQIY